MARRSRIRPVGALALASGLALLGSLVASAGPALAASPDAGAPKVALGDTFPHGYIETTLAPGQSYTTSLVVSDQGTAPATFLVSAVDGYTSSATGVVYGNRQKPLHDGPSGNGEYGAGSWITVSASTLHLDRNQSQTVTVSVAVPSSATPGDWVGGVTAENPQPTQGGSGTQQLIFTEATEVAVVVHVPGAVNRGALVLGAASVVVDGPSQFLQIPLRYTGDVLVKPRYSFTLRDRSGRAVFSHSGQWDTFVPHTTLLYRIALNPALPLGDYTFEGGAGPDSATLTAHNALRIGALPPVLPGDHRGGAATGPTQGPNAVLVLVPALLVLALATALMLRRAGRCSHCSARRLTGLMTVADFHEIAHCAGCRRRALEREAVRLCPDCYREHVLPGGKLSPRTT